MSKTVNGNLNTAKRLKRDEFYTQLRDIEAELVHYAEHFRGKTVLCNCDDPRVSNFFHYFSYGFESLGLKKLISICYKNQERDLFSTNAVEKAIWLEYDGAKHGERVPNPEEIGIHCLDGDGDFRSDESIVLLEQADIVVTNPPFSLFREYVAQLMKYDKKFIILGNKNAITYKDVFARIMQDRLWVGVSPMSREIYFDVPQSYIDDGLKHNKDRTIVKVDGKYMARSQSIWFTNLDHRKRHEELILYRNYDPETYPKYDNYDAIEVGKTADIPCDYDGVMGVPITFMDKYNPEQFEIVGATESEGKGFSAGLWDAGSGIAQPLVNGRKVYKRIFIRRRK